MKLAIIGGGASGLFLASYLKRSTKITTKDLEITIYERNKALGRKLLATGNGKCNFMNYKAMPYDYNNYEFMKNIFEICKPEDVLNYFQSLGLIFKFDEEGRMYPVSESSETILKLLSFDLKGVKIRLNETVEDIKYVKDGIIINNQDKYDYVVLASGSNASIDKKKTESTYKYIDNLKLNISPLKPSLVGFKVKNDVKMLSGYRAKALVTLELDGKEIKKELGEIIFKDDGISGICIMNLSRFYDEKLDFKLSLNLLVPASEALISINTRKKYSKDPNYYLEGVFHPKMIAYLIKNNELSDESITKYLTKFTLDIASTYDMSNAQISRGGISVDEINQDFSLKKYPNIFTTGEVLDIDGKCGGYNLLFAFISAMIVGKKLEETL